jgi:hypothetical protein
MHFLRAFPIRNESSYQKNVNTAVLSKFHNVCLNIYSVFLSVFSELHLQTTQGRESDAMGGRDARPWAIYCWFMETWSHWVAVYWSLSYSVDALYQPVHSCFLFLLLLLFSFLCGSSSWFSCRAPSPVEKKCVKPFIAKHVKLLGM